MNDIAASIGLGNLGAAISHVDAHRANAEYYDGHLPESICPPFDGDASYWIYTILVDDPHAFEAEMAERGIQASQVHARNDMQECLPDVDMSRPRPGLHEFSKHMVSIPVGWWLSSKDLQHIVDSVVELRGAEVVSPA